MSAIGLGKKRVSSGAKGMARAEAKREPMVVKIVIRIVAKIGWKSAPANTFCIERRSEMKREWRIKD